VVAGRGGRGGRQPQGGQPQIPAMMSPVPHVNPAAPAATDPNSELSAEERKNIVGERLYFLISKPQPALAGKITGMILDSSTIEELYQLIEEPATLEEKIEEALKVLEEHNKQQQQ